MGDESLLLAECQMEFLFQELTDQRFYLFTVCFTAVYSYEPVVSIPDITDLLHGRYFARRLSELFFDGAAFIQQSTAAWAFRARYLTIQGSYAVSERGISAIDLVSAVTAR